MIRFIIKLLRKYSFLLIFCRKRKDGAYEGGAVGQSDSSALNEVFYNALVEKSAIKEFVLGEVLRYLEKHQVEQKDFISQLYKNK